MSPLDPALTEARAPLDFAVKWANSVFLSLKNPEPKEFHTALRHPFNCLLLPLYSYAKLFALVSEPGDLVCSGLCCSSSMGHSLLVSTLECLVFLGLFLGCYFPSRLFCLFGHTDSLPRLNPTHTEASVMIRHFISGPYFYAQ